MMFDKIVEFFRVEHPVMCLRCKTILLTTKGTREERNFQALEWRKTHDHCPKCGRELLNELIRFDY